MRIDGTSFLLTGRVGLCVRAGASRSAAVTHIFRISLCQDHRDVNFLVGRESQRVRSRGFVGAAVSRTRDAMKSFVNASESEPNCSRSRFFSKLHDGMKNSTKILQFSFRAIVAKVKWPATTRDLIGRRCAWEKNGLAKFLVTTREESEHRMKLSCLPFPFPSRKILSLPFKSLKSVQQRQNRFVSSNNAVNQWTRVYETDSRLASRF